MQKVKDINNVEIIQKKNSSIHPSTIIYGKGKLILDEGASIEENCTIGLGDNGEIYIGKESRVTRSILECNDYSIFHGHPDQNKIFYEKAHVNNSHGKIIIGDYNAIAPYSLLIASLGGSIELSDHVNIMSSSLEADAGTIKIGSYSYTNRYAVINGMGGVTIGQHVLIAPHVVLYSGSHIKSKKTTISRQGFTMKGIVIEDDVWFSRR
jgi:acetyltransferase-like isoleucine patch superfamily enzyme